MAQNESRELTDVLLSNQKKFRPSKKVLKEANIKNYEAELKRAAKDPLKFWEEAAEELTGSGNGTKFSKTRRSRFSNGSLAANAIWPITPWTGISGSRKCEKKIAIFGKTKPGAAGNNLSRAVSRSQ